MIAHRKWYAFTSVEIMVIIVAAGLLAVVLYPMIGNARDKARQSTCMNNQKQLATALAQYAQDNNNTFPGTGGAYDGGACWQDAVQATHHARALFVCPGTMLDGSLAHPCYGVNGYLYGAHMTDLTDPVKTVLTADATAGVLLSANTIDRTRHHGEYLASFIDGHVETLNRDQDPVIDAEAEEGNYLLFGVTSIRIGFENDTTAVGTSKLVGEGTQVRLINQSDEQLVPQVTLTGGDLPPRQGLIPGSADLHLDMEQSKVFSLYCGINSFRDEPVDTTYNFGDAQHQVAITVRAPARSADGPWPSGNPDGNTGRWPALAPGGPNGPPANMGYPSASPMPPPMIGR